MDGAWAKIEVEGSAYRVGSERFADGPPPAEAPVAPAEESHGGPFGHVDSCPCTASHLCAGPEGGRFCVMSGGRKAYQ